MAEKREKLKNRKESVLKFVLLLLVLIFYYLFISIKYGAKEGALITLLTWTFFVLCTPIADAGFLLDFPIRLITNIRMLHTETIVWAIAITSNVFFATQSPQIYNKTFILLLLHHIITQPIPFWSVIFLSASGTFISIHLADELFDLTKNFSHMNYPKHNILYQIILFLFIILLILIIYDFLLKQLGIQIPF